jgi:carbonic anhydrase
LCELNVQRQVRNVCHTTIVQNAWRRGHRLAVHGWIYGLSDGLVKDLRVTVNSAAQLDSTFLYDQ